MKLAKVKAMKSERKAKKNAGTTVWIPGELGSLRALYKRYYPGDSHGHERAFKFMANKLMKGALKGKYKLTPNAKKLLEG